MFYQTSSNRWVQPSAAHKEPSAAYKEPSAAHKKPCAAFVQTLLLGLAAIASVDTAALPEDADQPIHISSKKAVWEKVGTATYNGNVKVNQGSLEISADVVTVEFEDERVVRVTATGDPARYKQTLEDDQQPVLADANVIVYHTRDERIDLEGEAHLNQKGNEFRGEVIAYDVREGRVDASTKTDERIRMVLQPKRTADATAP